MSPLEWLILAVIFALCVAASVFIRRMEKKGQHVPGRMCAGCPRTSDLERQEQTKP